MIRPTMRNLKIRGVIAVAAIFFLTGVRASANNLVDAWTLRISEKQLKLEHPTDMMWDKWLMWDIGSQRMVDRNMPYIEVTNNHPTDPITEFHLTIGDTRFFFGPVEGGQLAVLGSTTPGFDITSSTAGGLGDELIVNIGGGGLLPGELFRAKVKIDIDPSFEAQYAALFGESLPDFRTVLFDMNGKNVYDGNVTVVSSADNAKAWVVLDPATGPNVPTEPEFFPDESVPTPVFFNNNLRPYRESDPVQIFEIGGVIPEPGCAFLAMAAIVAGLLFGTRCRRVGSAA